MLKLMWISLIILVVGGAHADTGRAPPVPDHLAGYVIADSRDDAYVLFYRIDPKVSQDREKQLRERIARSPKGTVRLIRWRDVEEVLVEIVREPTRRNDYPEVDVASGIRSLLENYPGTAFGLTFNGGIAFTRSDYAHARKLHSRAAGDKMFKTRTGAKWDPIHPNAHLIPLLSHP